MPSVARLEAAALATWPALETVVDGQWQARFASGFSGRANSIWCLDPADDANAEARLATLATSYEARSLAPVFRVTPLTGRNTFASLQTLGWAAFQSSLVLSMPLPETAVPAPAAQLYDAADPAFLAIEADLQGFEGARLDAFSAIVRAIDAPTSGLVIADETGAPAAALICALSEDIAMVYDVITAKPQRGQGFGRRIMEAALAWAIDHKARHAALQVRADNHAALGLYLSLGFTFRYPYHYRRSPESSL